MDRGTYAATSGGFVQMRKLEVQNNNLANLNTAGFKRQYVTTETQNFDDTFAKAFEGKDPFARPDHERTPGAAAIRTITDFSQGPIKPTGNPLDVALKNPNDFFVINTPEGTEYTRAGNFTLSANGELVTQDGMIVNGDGGAVTINGPGAKITQDGSVVVNREVVARLGIVRFDNLTDLERVGSTRFKLPAGVPQPQAVDAIVEPESLEMPNVSAVTSMIDLIVTNRAFEAYTKAAQTIDQMNQTSITQIGRRT